MPTIKERLQNYLRTLIPVQRRPDYNQRAEPSNLLGDMDVDRIHSIFANAEAGDTRDLFTLYRDIILADSHLQTEFSKRKLAVLGDPLSVQPADKKKLEDGTSADFVGSQVRKCKGLTSALSHLLDASLYPVSVVEKIYRPRQGGGYDLDRLIPVEHQLLDFVTGQLRLREVDPTTGYPTGATCALDHHRYIVHRGHLLTSPDWYGGPMRSLVFWWLFSAMDREWWGRFLDRYGSGFMLGKYDQDDDASRSILERAFGYATKIGGLVVSKETEVEIIQAATSQTGEAYEKFLTICQREKSKLILGQTLSSEAQSTGMGSGVAKGQEAVRSDIRQFDAFMLGQTLTEHLTSQLLEINGLTGDAPRLIWAAESSEAAQLTGELLASLAQAGLQISDKALPVLSERVGLEIVRSPTGLPAMPGLSVLPLSAGQRRRVDLAALASARISSEGAPALAQAFRGSLAPVRRIILESSSAEECESRLREFYADWSPEKLAGLIAEALEAHAANGAAAHGR